MSVPKQRHTKMRRDRKRKRFAIVVARTLTCSKCGKSILSHRVCQFCGYYRNKEAINTLKKQKNKKK